MTQGQITVTEFIKEYKKQNSYRNDIILKLSDLNTFDSDTIGFSKEISEENNINKQNSEFDLVVGDFPFSMQRVAVDFLNFKISQNWNLIYNSLKLLNNGTAFFVVEPSIYYSKQGKDFFKALDEFGYYNNGVYNLPEKTYTQTGFKPIIISFTKNKTNKLVIANLEIQNIQNIVKNSIARTGSNISNGMLIEKKSFSTFHKIEILNQISRLKTHYKEYDKYQLSEISTSINLSRERFEDLPNCIYIPKIGTSKVVSSLEEIKIKHQNLFQIVLNDKLVLADYLAIFYKSELGQLMLNSLVTGYIPAINKKNIEDSYVAIPKLPEQTKLIHTYNKLNDLQETISDLQIELGLNPKNADVILEKFDAIQKPLLDLTKEDSILSLIRKGEGKKIEFKQTFSKNIRTNKKDKEIEKSSLKNIVGFLNAEGGTLLIGVSDDEDVTGIEDDYYQSNDKYLLHFKNAINTKIGSEFYPLIDYDIYEVLGKRVLKIDCLKSSEPCFYEEKEFFVRTNPATDKLEGKKQREYIKRRFD